MLEAGVDVAADVELALTGERAMVDDLVHRIVHVLDLAVGELDPRQVLDGDATELVGRDPELRHVPGVDGDPAVGGARAGHDLEGGVDRVDVDVGGHQLVDDLRIRVPGGVFAQLAEALGELRERCLPAEDVGDLDVVRTEDAGRLEQQCARLVGGPTALVVGIEEPVQQALDLEVTEPVVVEGALHLLQAPGLEHVLQIGMPDAEAAEADLAGLGAAVVPVEEAPLASDVHLDRARDRPVERNQLDPPAHHSRCSSR